MVKDYWRSQMREPALLGEIRFVIKQLRPRRQSEIGWVAPCLVPISDGSKPTARSKTARSEKEQTADT